MRKMVLAGVIIGLAALALAGAAAQEGDPICPAATAGNLALTEAGFTLTGEAKCIYGPVLNHDCPSWTLDGRLLIETVIKADGRVKCVYVEEGA